MKKLSYLILGSVAGILSYAPITFAAYVPPTGAHSAAETASRASTACLAIKEVIAPAFLNSLAQEIPDFSSQTGYSMPADQLTKINAAWSATLSEQSGACYSGAACTVRIPTSNPSVSAGTLNGCALGDVLLECNIGASACNPYALNAMKMVICPKAKTDEPKEPAEQAGFHVQFGAVLDQTEIVTILREHCNQNDISAIEGFNPNIG